MNDDVSKQITQAAETIANTEEADVLLINGPIRRPLDLEAFGGCRERRRRKNLFLVLVTSGGDAHVAFRLARCFQNNYSRFTVFVSGYCKSAGTLLAVGANELVMADAGELGPLDVQMIKPDELIQMQSGLTATTALSTLHIHAFEAFEHFFLQTVARSGNSISTRTATQIAVQLASGLFAPIYQHVDPMHVGEAGRALEIAQKYGELLQERSGNFSSETLTELTSGYPAHEFVVDRAEAQRLFRHVREPNSTEQTLARLLGGGALVPIPSADQRIVAYLSPEQPEPVTLPGFDERGHEQTLHTEPDTLAAGTSQPETGPSGKPGAAPTTDGASAATVPSCETGAGDRKAEPAGSVPVPQDTVVGQGPEESPPELSVAVG